MTKILNQNVVWEGKRGVGVWKSEVRGGWSKGEREGRKRSAGPGSVSRAGGRRQRPGQRVQEAGARESRKGAGCGVWLWGVGDTGERRGRAESSSESEERYKRDRENIVGKQNGRRD